MLTIKPVTQENLPLLGAVHAAAWRETHRDIVAPAFLALHTPERHIEKFRARMF